MNGGGGLDTGKTDDMTMNHLARLRSLPLRDIIAHCFERPVHEEWDLAGEVAEVGEDALEQASPVDAAQRYLAHELVEDLKGYARAKSPPRECKAVHARNASRL